MKEMRIMWIILSRNNNNFQLSQVKRAECVYFAIFCVFVWQFDILIIERNRNIFWISFVVLENIRTFASYCLPVTWDWRKDGTKLLIAQFSTELRSRKKKDEQIITTLEWALYAQTSTYVVMGCRRPGRDYGEVCAFFISISLVLTFPSWER